MSRVPDTNTYALSDVVTVMQEDTTSHSINSVSNNGGKAQLNTSGVFDDNVEIGDKIDISGSTYYNGTRTVLLININYIVITVGYAGDDVGFWEVNVDRLSECFDLASAIKFDPLYEGSKDRQSNFRNYGWETVPSLVDTEDHGNNYRGVHGNGDYIFIACAGSGNYIRSYRILSDGNMSYGGTGNVSGWFNYIWVENDFIFVTDNEDKVSSWTYDAFGDLTRVTDIDRNFDTPTIIVGDGNKFIFTVENETPGKIATYEYNGSTGALNYKTEWSETSSNAIRHIFYAGNYLFATGSRGIISFEVNQTTGELTEKDDKDNSWSTVWNDIYSDGNYLYVGTSSYGLTLWTWNNSTGELIYEDQEHTSPAYTISHVYGDSKGFIYTITSNGYIAVFQVASGDTLFYRGKTASTYATLSGLWCPPAATNSLVVVTRENDGVSSFELT